MTCVCGGAGCARQRSLPSPPPLPPPVPARCRFLQLARGQHWARATNAKCPRLLRHAARQLLLINSLRDFGAGAPAAAGAEPGGAPAGQVAGDRSSASSSSATGSGGGSGGQAGGAASRSGGSGSGWGQWECSCPASCWSTT